MKRFFLLIPALFILSQLINAQNRKEWYEFYLPWDDTTRTVTDVSGLLDPPAGKYGFLKVTPNGHFKFEGDSTPVKFAGVVNVALANFPTHAQAKILAARMAKFGINLLRIHLIDVDGQYGLFQNSSTSTQTLDPERLDRMDYLIKCVKDKGIYFNFCIQSGRVFKDGDIPDAPVLNDQSKYVTLFNPRLIRLQENLALQTLGHVNPYTGLSYAGDPAMATVELTNENSLFNGWFGWQSDYLFPENPNGIGPYYSAELDTLFNDWLAAKYTDDGSLRTAWSGAGLSGPEKVLNPSFEIGLNNWSPWIETSSGASGNITSDNGDAAGGAASLKVTVTTPGTERWHIQLKTNNFTVEKGESCRLSFYARADAARELYIDIMENVTWDWIMGPSWTTDTAWQKYEIYFVAKKSTDNLIIQFNFGLQPGIYRLDSVSVKRFGGRGIENGESLVSRNVVRAGLKDIGKYSSGRIGDNAEFYYDLEKHYGDTLGTYLKNTLGVKCPVTYTNNYYGLASIFSQSGADYIDTHNYWDHPGFPHGWSETDFTMNNRSMLLSPESSTLNRMPLCRVKNMPLMVSEYNHPYPYIYQAEAPSLLYAYGSYLDLDGILWHAYYDYMNRFDQRQQDMFFDVAMDPVIMTQMLLAFPYRMGYIHPPSQKVFAHYKREDVFQNTKTYLGNSVINMPEGEYGSSFLRDGFETASFDDDSTWLEGSLSMPGNPVSSENSELKWDGDQGIFTVNNPYWQGVTGFLKGKTIELGDIILSGITTTDDLDFAAVHLISLDSLPIRDSKKLILLTSARLENQGFLWNETRTAPLSIGGTKALCEPVTGTMEMKYPIRDSFYVYRLGTRGERSAELAYDHISGRTVFNFEEKTLWYEILNDSSRIEPGVSRKNGMVPQLGITSYPNPCDDFTIVEFSGLPVSQAKLEVFNAQGNLVHSEAVPAQGLGKTRIKLDVRGQSRGLYFYGLRMKDGRSEYGKFVIVR